MNKVEQFLQKHGVKVIIILLFLTYMKSCSVNSELTKVRKELQSQKTVIDSLPSTKDLEIEGLKAEKRMIQATDRKMLDVQRQSQIDAELKRLGAK
jgi:ABC-type transport system involved in cytochrome bd biosynthesis fused ATPase/permease subunit